MKLQQIQEYTETPEEQAVASLGGWSMDEHQSKNWEQEIKLLLTNPQNRYDGRMFRFLGQENIRDQFDQSQDMYDSWSKTLKGTQNVMNTEVLNGFQESRGIIITQTNVGVDVARVLKRYKYGDTAPGIEEEVIANYNNPTIYGTYAIRKGKVRITKR